MRISDTCTVRTVRYATEDGEELPAGRWAAYFRDGDVAFVAWELFEGEPA